MFYGEENKYLAPTNKQEFCPSHICYFFFKKFFYPQVVTWINWQSDCNLSSMTKTKELEKDTRDKIVDPNKNGMNQYPINKQANENRSTVGVITREWRKYKITDNRHWGQNDNNPKHVAPDLIWWTKNENEEETANNYTEELANGLKRAG